MRSSIPASVRDSIEGAGVGTVLQFPPALLVDGDGATPSSQIVTEAVASIGRNEAIASKLLIGVLLSIAGSLIHNIVVGRW